MLPAKNASIALILGGIMVYVAYTLASGQLNAHSFGVPLFLSVAILGGLGQVAQAMGRMPVASLLRFACLIAVILVFLGVGWQSGLLSLLVFMGGQSIGVAIGGRIQRS